jgi:hypothetical protein
MVYNVEICAQALIADLIELEICLAHSPDGRDSDGPESVSQAYSIAAIIIAICLLIAAWLSSDLSTK